MEILDEIEKLVNKTFIKEDMKRLIKEVLKAAEYDRSIEVALLNWTSGVAQGLVKYGTEGGLDAWRKLCNKYISQWQTTSKIF